MKPRSQRRPKGFWEKNTFLAGKICDFESKEIDLYPPRGVSMGREREWELPERNDSRNHSRKYSQELWAVTSLVSWHITHISMAISAESGTRYRAQFYNVSLRLSPRQTPVKIHYTKNPRKGRSSLTPSTQCYLFPILICFFHVETHKVSTSMWGGSHVLLHKPWHEQFHSARSSCTAPERVRKRSKFGSKYNRILFADNLRWKFIFSSLNWPGSQKSRLNGFTE